MSDFDAVWAAAGAAVAATLVAALRAIKDYAAPPAAGAASPPPLPPPPPPAAAGQEARVLAAIHDVRDAVLRLHGDLLDLRSAIQDLTRELRGR